MSGKQTFQRLVAQPVLQEPQHFEPIGCAGCRDGKGLGIDITMAFQPIVDWKHQQMYGYEALVRGKDGAGAYAILSQVTDENRYAFDQACRIKAIDLASSLGLQGMLSINFLPNAVYRPQTCIRATLEAARERGFPLERLMFEVTESEQVTDVAHLTNIFVEYKRQGFTTAIDDFGAGHSGLNLLASFQPDIVKLDMALSRNIDTNPVRQMIVSSMIELCKKLKIRVLAEGVETVGEATTLLDMGVELFQGYLFAKPMFEGLPPVDFEVLRASGLKV